ncbi:hypothetical protein ACH4UM_34725 [Streptomyces sp. NPDC020801]|uniref:hypothetical protein n=1 Tax=unclassified Streptomyces TaxID=2593676 RepID=UPI0037930C6F
MIQPAMPAALQAGGAHVPNVVSPAVVTGAAWAVGADVPQHHGFLGAVLEEPFEEADDTAGAAHQVLGHPAVCEHAAFGLQQTELLFECRGGDR